MLRSFLLAVRFLTIAPAGEGKDVSEAELAGSAGAFPLVGLLQGALLVLTDVLIGGVLPPDLVAALVLLVLVVTSGGLHLDGLADTADALAAPGGRQRKLSAMKDSASGPIGVTAIVFCLGIKYLAIRGVADLNIFTYYFSLLLMPALSRWVMLLGMFHGAPAREDGMGSLFLTRVGGRELALGTLTAVVFMSLPVLLMPGYAPPCMHAFNAAALVVLYAGGRVVFGFFHRKFGGLTGDTLGAAGELAENVFLVMVLIWSGLYTS